MNIADVVGELETVGVRLWEEEGQLRFRGPHGVMTEERRAILRTYKQDVLDYLRRDQQPLLVADAEARFRPFPLTDVQAAYLLGQRQMFAYGGVACHGYGEIAILELDPVRLEAAWQVLIDRHDMLRAIIDLDGSQRVLPDTPAYRMAVRDLRGAPPDAVKAAIERTRAELSHKKYASDQWPLFTVSITWTSDRSILHVSVDFLIADYVSIHLLLDELYSLYTRPKRALPELSITFCDYLLGERRLRSGRRYEVDRDYWWKRVDSFPAAPELPLAAPGTPNTQVRFRSRQAKLEPHVWQALQHLAGSQTVTPSGAILAAYAEVMARWARHPRFSLNITLLQRLPIHPDVSRIVGDFTSVSLLSVEHDASASFRDRARTLQEQLWKDIDHRLCSGIEVIREIARRRGASDALMPVVFTSTIGLDHDSATGGSSGSLFEFVYAVSQTPQVWIDCQVMERGGRLELRWDVREGIFPDDLIDDMFQSFEVLLRRLADSEDIWNLRSPLPLPARQLERRKAANDTAGPLPDGLLQEAVVARALRDPDGLALVSGFQFVSYGDLVRRALAVANALRERNLPPGSVVAVVMEKGAEQVTAVLGILLADAAYLPVDMTSPRLRRNRILESAQVRYAVTQSWVDAELPDPIYAIAADKLPLEPLPTGVPPSQAKPDDLAYMIFTSGTTGEPKGVMISHRSALNTIFDVNRRFNVNSLDRVLGLSQLGFDLSVYDIFGPLSVGAACIMPNATGRADPSHWARLVAEHDVTIWNSVPAQAQMLHEYLHSEPVVTLPSLRLAMISGDWIPVSLPGQLRKRLPGLQLVSLGGATEASIWSIVYPIDEVSQGWPSIPYGKPLTNQTFHVLDDAFRPCPEWTIGNLYIGGAGLAIGYFGDETMNAQRFIRHPDNGERLYRTGDLGRCLPDGNIEFLGREDSQVKIRGHRIELAEIEAALQAHPAVAASAVLAFGVTSVDRQLGAFVESARRADNDHLTLAADVASAAEAAGVAIREGVASEPIVQFAHQLDKTALLGMLYAFEQQGLFACPEDTHSLSEILARAAVAPQHHRLVRRWLNALVANGMLEQDHDGNYHDAAPVTAKTLDQAWRTVEELRPPMDRRAELLEYFQTAALHLPELLRGELDPLQLLFPQGDVKIHEVAYNGSFLSQYLNRLVTTAARRIAELHIGSRPLQVLEIGAGVGGTSIELIPSLSGFRVEYLFTDVSKFFLNLAQDRFGGYPWVKYALFDMNKDYRSQGLSSNTFDLIVCANVLHYALNADLVLKTIRELLRPDGWLVFIDMVRDNYQVLTSMEFLFDATFSDFDDVRRGHDATFINLDQWHGLLKSAGAETAMCLPRADDPLFSIGFHVFAAQFKTDREPLDTGALSSFLAERLPDYFVPSRIELVDALPLTANGKIDRNTLSSWLSMTRDDQFTDSQEQPSDDLERRLAAIWSKTIGVAPIGRNVNFFEIGGDSLLAAQLVGRIREEMPEAQNLFFDRLLHLMLEGPTVAQLATSLRKPIESPQTLPKPQASPLIHLGGFGSALRVLVHDSSGTLASYNELLPHLAQSCRLAGLAVDDPKAYLQQQPGMLIERAASHFVRAIQSEAQTDIHVVGFDAGALFAVETASQLLEAGIPVGSLTLIGSIPFACAIEDELLIEYLFVRGSGVDPMRLGFPAEPALAQALALIRSETLDRVPEGRLAQCTGNSALDGVSWCFRRLLDTSHEDRMTAFARVLASPQKDPAPLNQVLTLYRVFRHNGLAAAVYRTRPYAGDMVLLIPSEQDPLWPSSAPETISSWRRHCLGELRVINIDGSSYTCRSAKHAARLAQRILDRNG